MLNAEPITKQRFAAIDALRLFALAAVVAGHVWTSGAGETATYTWHVPVFFLLTGYLWRPGRSVSTEVTRRAKSLLVPYAAWLLLLALAVLVRGQMSGRTLADILLGGEHAVRPFTAFWFVTALFFATVIYRLLEQRLGLWQRWAVVGVAVIVTYAAGGPLSELPLSVGMVAPAILFLMLGEALRDVEPSIPAKPMTGGVLTALAVLVIAAGWDQPMDWKHGDLGRPVESLLVAACLGAGLVLLAKSVPLAGRAGDAATRLAEAGLVLVLGHAAVLWVLNTPAHGRLLGFLAALVVPLAAGLLLSRTRLAPLLLGRSA